MPPPPPTTTTQHTHTHTITTHTSPWGDHLSCAEEFTVVPRVPPAQTYSIPLEIYVPAAVVSSAFADLEDNAVPGIMRGSNPLHTSGPLFRARLFVCTCKPFTPCLRTSISVVNGERFPCSCLTSCRFDCQHVCKKTSTFISLNFGGSPAGPIVRRSSFRGEIPPLLWAKLRLISGS